MLCTYVRHSQGLPNPRILETKLFFAPMTMFEIYLHRDVPIITKVEAIDCFVANTALLWVVLDENTKASRDP